MTDAPAPKNAWTKCPACSTVMPNIQIAKDGHKLNCPHDIQLRLQKALERIGELEKKVENLGGNLDEISQDPGVDFAGIDDWGDDEQSNTYDVVDHAGSVVGSEHVPAESEDDGWADEVEDELERQEQPVSGSIRTILPPPL